MDELEIDAIAEVELDDLALVEGRPTSELKRHERWRESLHRTQCDEDRVLEVFLR